MDGDIKGFRDMPKRNEERFGIVLRINGELSRRIYRS